MRTATTITVPEISSEILQVLMRHQRQTRQAPCRSRPCERCLAVHRNRVGRFVSRGVPIDLVLPAFPSKSPNPRKVLGVAPDMAEQLALDSLREYCAQIHRIYPPGARIIICSDGHVFCDLLGVDDVDVSLYHNGLTELVDRVHPNPLHPNPLQLYSLDDHYQGYTYQKMRQLLMEHHAEDMAELKQKVRAGDLLTLYRGLTRFLVEDADRPDYRGSRAALQRECRKRAYGVMQRSRAWGRLIAERFPEAVRLSIHPQPCGADKLGIMLLNTPDNWITPWHGTAVDIDGRFVLMKRYEAESLGADLVYVNGRPSHYVLHRLDFSRAS